MNQVRPLAWLPIHPQEFEWIDEGYRKGVEEGVVAAARLVLGDAEVDSVLSGYRNGEVTAELTRRLRSVRVTRGDGG